jgi:DNA-binding CsgD family transcriptional regulator
VCTLPLVSAIRSSRHVPANDLSVFQTNVYTSVLGSNCSPLIPADTTSVRLSVTLPGVHATAGAVGAPDRMSSPKSPPRLNFTGTPNVAGKLFAQVASPTVARDTTLATSLSDRERDVLRLLAQGLSNAEIAGSLFLSEGTIRNYVSAIFEKLGVSDRTRAALMAVRHGLVD